MEARVTRVTLPLALAALVVLGNVWMAVIYAQGLARVGSAPVSTLGALGPLGFWGLFAMLAYRDGGELVAAAHAFGLGEVDPTARLEEILGDPVAAATVLYFVLGHVTDEQLALQAGSAGAIDSDPLARTDTFADGLAIVVAGIAAQNVLSTSSRTGAHSSTGR